MKAERRTTAPGTARKPAARKRSALQPANLVGTLSYQAAGPSTGSAAPPGIGGVLEPLQAEPVIIEDNCFIGARSEVAEGVIVETGSVLSMGVFIGASTKIVDRVSGEVHVGRVPAYSVVVPGNLPGKLMRDGNPGPSTYCAVIVKRVDEKTRAKTSINELLRG